MKRKRIRFPSPLPRLAIQLLFSPRLDILGALQKGRLGVANVQLRLDQGLGWVLIGVRHRQVCAPSVVCAQTRGLTTTGVAAARGLAYRGHRKKKKATDE